MLSCEQHQNSTSLFPTNNVASRESVHNNGHTNGPRDDANSKLLFSDSGGQPYRKITTVWQTSVHQTARCVSLTLLKFEMKTGTR